MYYASVTYILHFYKMDILYFKSIIERITNTDPAFPFLIYTEPSVNGKTDRILPELTACSG